MDLPKNLKYTKDHEWALIKGEDVTVGITEYAVTELGDIVYVELPDVGDSVEQHKPFGNVESVKAVSELFAPLSGEVTAKNADLAETPEILNDDPYGEGWMIKIKLSEKGELDELMSAEQYAAYLDEIA